MDDLSWLVNGRNPKRTTVYGSEDAGTFTVYSTWTSPRLDGYCVILDMELLSHTERGARPVMDIKVLPSRVDGKLGTLPQYTYALQVPAGQQGNSERVYVYRAYRLQI